jgi:uncharacterized protein
MHNLDRYIKKSIIETLDQKMAFIGGPRQVGKTTFAMSLLKNPSPKHPVHFHFFSEAVDKLFYFPSSQ